MLCKLFILQQYNTFAAMKYAERYLQTAVSILDQYDGSLPLHHFLKGFFATDKKYGSKDRRNIGHLCYTYFRLGHALTTLPKVDRIRIALYLTNSDEWAVLFHSTWPLEASAAERLELISSEYDGFAIDQLFPFPGLSEGMDRQGFAVSHLHQPKFFIRIRKGQRQYVLDGLQKANVPFVEEGADTLSFHNNTKLEEHLDINKDYVVQDLSSQKVGRLMELVKEEVNVWDCCAASGGKAIMATDTLQVKRLLVTDIRESIIQNLRNRFKEAGINNYKAMVADVANAAQLAGALGSQRFNLIICDAPCSGSGTWGRTPEQLYYFKKEKISYYANLQRSIASNAVAYLQPAGHFLYITCSVFKAENEEVVNFLQQKFHLQLVKMELIKGYDEGADTMFAALLTASPA